MLDNQMHLGRVKALWGNMFIRDFRQLGPNLWLCRYTKDMKGKSHVEYIGLIYWAPPPSWADQATFKPGFEAYGVAKRNRRKRQAQAIAITIGNYAILRQLWEQARSAEVYLPDEDEDWERAASLLVMLGRLILPTEIFYDLDELRFPDYGDITRS